MITTWKPRTLRDPDEQDRRRELLRTAPHIASLASYVENLRRRPNCQVPDFDPCDGGVHAKMLFLFEKPGPMTDASNGERRGSGFISRDNDDPTAEATGCFMAKAEIPREAIVLWNTIPWWNGTIAITADEKRRGIAEVSQLLKCLPQVRTVVLVGRKAQQASASLRDLGLAVFHSAHPSARVRASYREQWNAIPDDWREAFEQSM